MLTEQREELREAVLAEALRRHGAQAARLVLVYPQLDKLSTAWKLGLPGPTGLTPAVFKEVHLCLPSLACSSILGQAVGMKTVGPFADELMTAALTQDTWRTRQRLCQGRHGQHRQRGKDPN